MAATNFDTIALDELAATCNRLDDRADELVRERIRVREMTEAGEATEADVTRALGAEVTARNLAAKCRAAIAARRAGRRPDASTLTNEEAVVTINRGGVTTTSASRSIDAVLSDLAGKNPPCRGVAPSDGVCVSKSKQGTVSGGTYVRGLCPGDADQQCLKRTSAKTTAPTRTAPTRTAPVKTVPTVNDPLADLAVDDSTLKPATMSLSPQAMNMVKLVGIAAVPVIGALLYKHLA